MKIAIIHNKPYGDAESFVKAHIDRLPGEVSLIYDLMPQFSGKPLLRASIGTATRAAWRFLSGLRTAKGVDRWAITNAYLEGLRQIRPDVVLAEYGTVGALAYEACQIARVPYVVHFHGHDASRKDTLQKFQEEYQAIFQSAAEMVVVSDPMRARLLELGAKPERLHMIPYGVELPPTHRPERGSSCVFLTAGRMVEKKAPHLTLLAFHKVHQQDQSVRLRMIGDGPLLSVCRDLAKHYGLQDAVQFLGPLPHAEVLKQMLAADIFVQHSVEASDGDCEGTPVAILEAGAAGLPVVSTLHAGIPAAVVDGETGLLVEEHDVEAMVDAMMRLSADRELRDTFGRSAVRHIREHYSMNASIDKLHDLLTNVANLETA